MISSPAQLLARSLLAIACAAMGCVGGADPSSSGAGARTPRASGDPLHPCVEPQPILVGGVPTGMQSCADGSLEKLKAAQCSLRDLAADPICVSGTPEAKTCAEECPEAPHGRPRRAAGLGVVGCDYFCATDADCPSSWQCTCGADGEGQCHYAE